MGPYLQICPPFNTTELIASFIVDLGESGRWNYFTIQALLFYGLLFVTIFSIKKKSSDSQKEKLEWLKSLIKSNITFVTLVILFIIISRVPLAAKGTTNIDENTWIAIAKILEVDARYWVSADGYTGGPLVPLTLLSFNIFGLPIDSGSLKIMSALIISVSIGFTFLFLANLVRSGLARLAILPLVVAFAMTDYYDMIAYNSEHIVIFLLSLSLVFFAQLLKKRAGKYLIYVIILGVLLGLVPFAKLQGAPIALFIGILSCIICFKEFGLRTLLILVSSSLVPTIFILLSVWIYGGIQDFWTSYIEGNLVYATRNPTLGNPLGEKLKLLFDLLFHPPTLKFFLYYSLTSILICIMWVISFGKKLDFKEKAKFLTSLAMVVVSAYCVVVPNNPFHHYMLLVLIPLTIATAAGLNSIVSILELEISLQKDLKIFEILRPLFASLFIITSSLFYFQQHFSYQPNYLDFASRNKSGYSHYPEIADVLKQYKYPGARMAIWGWSCELYEDTGLLMGTRYTGAQGILEGGVMGDYFSANFLSDLKINSPIVFIEMIGPTFRAYHDKNLYSFEHFKNIKEYVDEYYYPAAEVSQARIFVRK